MKRPFHKLHTDHYPLTTYFCVYYCRIRRSTKMLFYHEKIIAKYDLLVYTPTLIEHITTEGCMDGEAAHCPLTGGDQTI